MTDPLVILITGGSSGIGAAAARMLLDRGHRVAITGRDRARLDRFTESRGRPEALLSLTADAADHHAMRSTVEATLKRFGRLDAVVANAGSATPDSVIDGDPTRWREMVLTNVLGPALLIRSSVEALRATRGRIILVGSVAGFIHTPGNLYGATKWAMTGLAENTRRAVTGHGVGVTLIAPGRVDTGFWESLGGPPEGQLLTAEQVAESIVWAVCQPSGVDVNTVVIRPIGQPV
ncbi:SDR family oxidoreductase [Streptosporangium pseudovulgare]|uniref:Oxidoreductase n=1 Tax=Streptosporangium pseudovulgare TaxID=35765 RepID=A0ABQ2RCW0_9ACTN|nr:SDR family oxidoreductase [Streptosporangium pseudovulgare]GGQ24451.1 oxidoreductase [Streptosporangium pseudovulgare]